MKQTLRTFFTGAILAWTAAAATVTLTAFGPITPVAPGQTVGFGFDLLNYSPSWVVFTNSWFCDTGQDPTSTTCAPALGVYTDFLAANALVLPPASGLPTGDSELFDPVAEKGLGSFKINTDGVSGQDVGAIVVSYDLWDANPFTAASANLLASDQFASGVAGIQVRAASIPEPGTRGTAALSIVALCAAYAASRIRKPAP